MPKIVKEPAIERGFALCSLNFSHPFCWRLLCTHRWNKSDTKIAAEKLMPNRAVRPLPFTLSIRRYEK